MTTPLFQSVFNESSKPVGIRKSVTVRVVMPDSGSLAGKFLEYGKAHDIVKAAVSPWMAPFSPTPLNVTVIVMRPGSEEAKNAKSVHKTDPLGILITFDDIYATNFTFGRSGPDEGTIEQRLAHRWMRLSRHVRYSNYTKRQDNPIRLLGAALTKLLTLGFGGIELKERTHVGTVITHEVGHLFGLGHPSKKRRDTVMWLPAEPRQGDPIIYEEGWAPGPKLLAFDAYQINELCNAARVKRDTVL